MLLKTIAVALLCWTTTVLATVTLAAAETTPLEAVAAACEGRSETEGPYPIDCDCFRACVADPDGPEDREDCIGLCD